MYGTLTGFGKMFYYRLEVHYLEIVVAVDFTVIMLHKMKLQCLIYKLATELSISGNSGAIPGERH